MQLDYFKSLILIVTVIILYFKHNTIESFELCSSLTNHHVTIVKSRFSASIFFSNVQDTVVYRRKISSVPRT